MKKKLVKELLVFIVCAVLAFCLGYIFGFIIRYVL
jgi:hypothetical protein